VLVAAAAPVFALGACGTRSGPQAGVAPRGSSSSDAGVTNGAISYTTRDLVGMMGNIPTQAERQQAAFRAGQLLVGQPTPPPPRLDPQGIPDYFGGAGNWANSQFVAKGDFGTIAGSGIRKFVDELPGVGKPAANGLGQYIPVAAPDTTTYPGSDFYVIAVREFSERLHRDLPKTRLRGYVQLNRGTDAGGRNTLAPAPIHSWGPLIRARRGRPVRVKFVNQLPAGEAGDLFLPVDTTVPGAGVGPRGGSATYTQNRASLHLHGGLTPWISGGTPDQWITPAGDDTPYRAGASLVNVPDMWFDAQGSPVDKGTPSATDDPGAGATTLYFPNDQSARFLYLHDDTYGLTRLNVYAGETAPYVLGDPVEHELVAGNANMPPGQRKIARAVRTGTVPADELPLIIEDKTFVPGDAQLTAQDPTWDKARWGGRGALWYPHVYMPNENAYDNAGLNAMGRWDYLPWYWKGHQPTKQGPISNPLYGAAAYEAPKIPGTPSPSVVPNAFFDAMLVNGTAYPYTKVLRKAYRLRILNACSDRSLNLQLYYAASNDVTSTGPGGRPELQAASGEVPMTPAVKHSGDASWPARWPTDARAGGVPDPRAVGPTMIQIGNDGGLLPAAALLPNTPVGFLVSGGSKASAGMAAAPTAIGITQKTLYLAPGERADIIVDFSQVPRGAKLILYNDAPAPAPSGDSRVDYYTGAPDLRSIGGAPGAVAGYGPNTRTIMQFQVEGEAGRPFDLTALRQALPAAFAASQDPILVPETAYGRAYGATFLEADAQEKDGVVTFTPLDSPSALTLPVQGKVVTELFDPAYGRKTGTLGVEAPLSASGVRTAVPLSAIDPATEYVTGAAEASSPVIGDGTQLWRITHDGTVSHSVSFRAFCVQVVARASRDGKARPPDPGELGWKDTVRIDPLETCLVALRPVLPRVPFKLPSAERPLDVTRPLGATGGFTELDPLTAAPASVSNRLADFGWETAWGLHLPGGEENHQTRPLVFQGSPGRPRGLTAKAAADTPVALAWTNDLLSPKATAFLVERAGDKEFRGGLASFRVAGPATTFTDESAPHAQPCFYRVRAENASGYSLWSAPASLQTK
jgi:FtsP/CotA-like multicopper oxidase with cupredoxin domain